MEKLPENYPDRLEPVILSSNLEISPGVHLISWERKVDFLPGQVLKIAVNFKEPPRIYSICSGNTEPEISVLFNVKAEGSLTPVMAGLRPGDHLLVSKPYGSYTGDNQPAWWIATGTGIAPFYSMFKSGLGSNKTLIHGVRFLNQFYFEREFEFAIGKQYFRCGSQQSSRGIFPGRVTDFLRAAGAIPPHIKYYLCGNGLMVVEVRDFLIKKGIPVNQIISEIYF
jgi:ferredoxin/flavodoxin---NADP+ reductase